MRIRAVNPRKKQKQETRVRILRSASQLFRKQGISATGVDQIMARAGLTAGGFYAHFQSKRHLLREAVGESLAGSWRFLSGMPLERAMALYLSEAHRDRPERGCPLVGMAAELARHSRSTAKPIAEYLEHWIESLMGNGMRRDQAIRRVASAVGALLLARLVKGIPLSAEILEATKKGEW